MKSLAQVLSERTVAHRGGECEFCGRAAKPWPRTGKRRYPHKCPHGLPCARGDRTLGFHQNHPVCQDCRASKTTIYGRRENAGKPCSAERNG